MKNKETLGRIIKNKRKRYGITQKEFCFRTGIGLATLRDIEQGKKTIKLSSLIAVTDALGLIIKLEDKQ